MKWTGHGVLVIDGKKNKKKNIYPGDNIPDGILSKDRIEKFKNTGLIDGMLSHEAYEKVLDQAEKNKQPSEIKEALK